MIIDAIPQEKTVEQLTTELSEKYENVKQKGKNTISLIFEGNKLNIVKKKKGFDVSPDVPGYMFFIFYTICFILFISSMNLGQEEISSIIGYGLGSALLPAFIVYWIFAEIYAKTKKKKVENFCKSFE